MDSDDECLFVCVRVCVEEIVCVCARVCVEEI